MKKPVLVLAVLMVVAGCAGSPAATPVASARPAMAIHVGDGTTLEVSVVVNGQNVGVIPAQAGGDSLDTTKLPALPWTVEARSPSGRVLTTMSVSAADAAQTDPTMHRIPSNWVDLSCGRLTIWAGDYAPSGGPAPPSPAGSPGDCAP